MPLLSPNQIHQVLASELPAINRKAESSLDGLLADAALSKEEVLEQLSCLMRIAESDSTRVKAAELALKLNGLLVADDRKGDFNLTIVINDAEHFDLNPILIPR